MFTKSHSKQRAKLLLSVPAPLFRQDGWEKQSTLSCCISTVTEAQHLAQNRFTQEQNPSPFSSKKLLRLKSLKYPVLQKCFCFPLLLWRRLEKSEFLQRKTWEELCANMCILHLAQTVCSKNSLREKKQILVIHSKQTLGWACLQSSNNCQNQFQVSLNFCLLLQWQIYLHEMSLWLGRSHLWHQVDYFVANRERSQVAPIFLRSLEAACENSQWQQVQGRRAPTMLHFSRVHRRKRKGKVRQQYFILICTSSAHKGTALLVMSYQNTACSYPPLQPVLRGDHLEQTHSNDFPSFLFKLVLQNSGVLFEQHKAASVTTHLHQNFLC